MKVRCIDNDEKLRDIPITEGKVYSVLGEINGCYMVINDNGEEGCYLKCRFEEVKEVEKEKVLEIEFQEVFDKVAWRIVYQNEDILKRGEFKDGDIRVRSTDLPIFSVGTLYILGYHRDEDKNVQLISKEEAELIKQKVDAINEKYGIPKKWRARQNGRYFYITGSGHIGYAVDCYIGVDDDRYKFGNYFKTKEEAQAKLDRIKQIFAE